LQLCGRIAQRRNPFVDQMRAVIGAEESFRSHEERVVVLVPTHAFAGAKRLRNFRLVFEAGAHRLEKAR